MQGRINERIITSLSELDALAAEVMHVLRDRQHAGSACVLALSGDLGAGKTTFVQAVARTLGVTEIVTSPTFVVMKQYETAHDQCAHLVHIDAYRIESLDEMRVLRFDEVLAEESAIVCIEWAEKIQALLPADTCSVTFAIVEDEQRRVTITYGTKNQES